MITASVGVTWASACPWVLPAYSSSAPQAPIASVRSSQPKPASDEFYVAGAALRVDDAAQRAAIFADVTHFAHPSEIAFARSNQSTA